MLHKIDSIETSNKPEAGSAADPLRGLKTKLRLPVCRRLKRLQRVAVELN